MKSNGAIKYIYDTSPFYVHWKKHFCPKCQLDISFQEMKRLEKDKRKE